MKLTQNWKSYSSPDHKKRSFAEADFEQQRQNIFYHSYRNGRYNNLYPAQHQVVNELKVSDFFEKFSGE